MSLPSFAAADLFGRLNGAVALVTGGGTGIGLYAARALASNGAKVIITGRRLEKLNEAVEIHGKGLEGSLVPLQLDVTDKEQLKKVAEEVHSKEGRLDILINNSGIAGPVTKFPDGVKNAEEYASKHLSNESFEQWNNVFNTNVTAVFFSTMTFLPLLEAGLKKPFREGFTPAIINITSISGTVKSAQNHFAYNSSKAAATHLTKMLAHEINYGHKAVPGIRVNSIAPGLFPSEMTSSGSEKGGHTEADSVSIKPPNGRVGTAAEMASAVLFLANNTFMQGQNVHVDGGWITVVPSSA
ncbi:unnamed protein product [Tilletia controversa]|uniref:Rhamnolipids biosynthesis 3-oxoacyl-[acyl-carrier-protein] reductase n=3 Tax=Tilletia TaxID=13289 RepID=A0A8X7SYC8_9BASI|nr:hypothetical protein CF336_g2497 [Tilletia laevis]KAE8199662.1 hypothetical protein CF328_g3183 [Tilletia controversa]KAE8262335.1 hypothetical protein A4X03_0g2536 [Tilletia caries]KAE8204385.1 hypothetical protein CF335_g2671 [Tilletia laevis]KAE8251926.1 hypothetical protein A4X06_0g2480 [Tilletia controversa]